jgi:Thioredoxin like C-terminal domain
MTANPILLAAISTSLLGAVIATFATGERAVRQVPAEAAPSSVGGELSSLDGATEWLHSQPLTAGDLRGKVVLVDFWNFTCNDHAIWRAFGNEYWPALYFIDSEGHVRHHQFGEGEYEQSERVLQPLLAEAGTDGVGRELVSVDARGVEAAADWDDLKSPETYLGLARTENFASPGGAALDARRRYAAPARLPLNHWALSGEWTIGKHASVLKEANGRLAYRFHARDLHLVMRPATQGESVRFRVLIDGRPPRAAHGLDVDADGNGTVSEQRLYQLVRQPGPIADRSFRDRVPRSRRGGVRVHVRLSDDKTLEPLTSGARPCPRTSTTSDASSWGPPP